MTQQERIEKQQAHDRWVHDRAFNLGVSEAQAAAAKDLNQAKLRAKIDLAHQLNGLVESTARAVIALVGSLDK